MKKGILLCYHGTRDAKGINDTKKLTNIFKQGNTEYLVKTGYLEITKPTIESQLNFFSKKKINTVNVIPAMIFSGDHVVKDIPKIISKFKKNNKKIHVSLGQPLFDKNHFLKLIKINLSKFKYNKNKACLIVIASNTASATAKKQINIIRTNLALDFKSTNSLIFLVGSNSDLLKERIILLHKKRGFINFVIMPIFLFRGRLLQSCINVGMNLKKTETKISYYLMPHLNNYQKVSQLMKKSIKF